MIDEMIKRFFEWINERHMIYLRYKVDHDDWPWTDDPIFQEYKFTNVFRELDTGTIWLKENWRDDFSDHPRLFFNICMYRQFNYWPTAKALGYMVDPYSRDPLWPMNVSDWNPEKIEIKLRQRKDEGEKIFTGSHMLTGTLGGADKKDKIWQVIWPVLNVIWENNEKYAPKIGSTLQQAYERLISAPGFGPFLSYEVVTDLRHTPYLENATDIMTWANPGPGAMRGINRIRGVEFGATGDTRITKSGIVVPVHLPIKVQSVDDYIADMRELLRISTDYIEDHVPDLEMRDIEHSLCEFDKYERVRLNEGRPRSRYKPPQV